MIDAEILLEEDFFKTTETSGITYEGSATCTIVKNDGTKEELKCTVSNKLSYQDAKSSLEASIKSEITSKGGKIFGSINFSIKKEL